MQLLCLRQDLAAQCPQAECGGLSTSMQPGGVWVLGFFDGVHRGHRALLREAFRLAGERETQTGQPCPVCVWTFASLPKASLVITTAEERVSLLREAGVSYMAVEAFPALREMSGDAFFWQYFLPFLHPAALVCGFNFRFGKNGGWGAKELCGMGESAGIPVCVVPPYRDAAGEVISSTRIRQAIQNGELEKASQLLGYPYFVEGDVFHGHALGRTIGFPTINQYWPGEKVAPPHSTYICRALFQDETGKTWNLPGVCNLGSRPTVNANESDVTLETYILHYQGDLYGRRIRIFLYKTCRPERKFASVEALAAQIRRDVETVEMYFQEKGNGGNG